MRPIDRGVSPIQGDYSDYRDAFPELASRLGFYCSYCERRMGTNLAVEHIQPKDPNLYPHLEGKWDNYVLGCVNCNGTKTNKDVALDRIYLPDRDNTFYAFIYLADGTIEVRNDDPIGLATLQLTGLDKAMIHALDQNGRFVAIDRVGQRMGAWGEAMESRTELESTPSDALRRSIVRLALARGFFSIWMKVFEGDPEMRKRFIEAFPGTARDCFDAAAEAISPRAGNGLLHAGKI